MFNWHILITGLAKSMMIALQLCHVMWSRKWHTYLPPQTLMFPKIKLTAGEPSSKCGTKSKLHRSIVSLPDRQRQKLESKMICLQVRWTKQVINHLTISLQRKPLNSVCVLVTTLIPWTEFWQKAFPKGKIYYLHGWSSSQAWTRRETPGRDWL
jgi:hypothetical protein